MNNIERASNLIFSLACGNGQLRLVFRMPEGLLDLTLLKESEREVTAIQAAIVQALAREFDLAERRKGKA